MPEGCLKIDNTSTLFAQHYTLIRELKNYVKDFRVLLKDESDVREVWKHFESLATILDTGCQYLNFPIQI